MKRAWDQVKLRVLFHSDGTPEAGDELHTRTGRRYLILSCTEKQITALVLPMDEPLTERRVWGWTWGAKRQQRNGEPDHEHPRHRHRHANRLGPQRA